MRFACPVARLLLAFAAATFSTVPAAACPFCDGGPAGRNEVREAVFGEGFGLHLAAVALPFLAAVALAGVVHGGAAAAQPPQRGSTDAPPA